MAGLQVRVFGKLSLQHGETKIDHFPTRRVEELLGYLILYRGTRHPREKLIETLWPDVELSNGRASLSTALWRLRSVFERLDLNSSDYIVAERDWIRFDAAEDMVLDLQTFRRHLADAEQRDGTSREESYRAAIESYSGSICEGIYAEWCLLERERTERSILKAMGKLMRLLIERQAYVEATVIGQDIIAIDPLREEVHRAVMFCYWRLGRRARAVRQFQCCARLLQAELHILPMPETISLYSQIVRERLDDLQLESRADTPYEYELNSAIAAFLDASEELNKLIELAESFWESPIPA